MQQLVEILNRARDALLFGLGGAALFMLVVAGIRLVTAGSEEGQAKAAKVTAKHALMGLGLALLAPVVISVFKSILGV